MFKKDGTLDIDFLMSKDFSEFSQDEANEFTKAFVQESANSIEADLMDTLNDSYADWQHMDAEFTIRNNSRWTESFKLLHALISICTEFGQMKNEDYITHAEAIDDLVFNALVRLHARACRVSQEILCLLRGGFADGAHARWRSLHEINITTHFIIKHGRECAERFFMHDVVENYESMKVHRKHKAKLKTVITDDEFEECKKEYNQVIKAYGSDFKEPYGWAKKFVENKGRVGFASLAKDVNMNHFEPYYKWASQNVHSGPKGIFGSLGLSESNADILLIGRSDAGMPAPSNATAISLMQLTVKFTNYDMDVSSVAIAMVIQSLVDKIQDATEKEAILRLND